MNPPWTAFPDSRVGDGMPPTELQDYGNSWVRWLFSLSREERDAYVASNAEPVGWKGFYESIGTHRLP
jgi:hypothetical protein